MPVRPSKLQRVWRCVNWPYRVWRERISIQMIFSYLAMVLLVLILFEATVLGSILLNPGDRFFATRHVTIDPYLGERSAAYVQWLEPDRIQEAMIAAPVNRVAINAVNGNLRQIATGDVPGFSSLSPMSETERPLILIVNPEGQIIASSDPQIPALTSIQRLPPGIRDTIASNQALAGAEDEQWNALYSLSLVNERTIVAYPIITDDGEWIGTFVLQGGAVSFTLGQTRGEIFQQVSVVFLQSLWIFAVPAVIVAIPFGMWRANSISRRLERLAAVAERMERGELNTRLRVRKHDEIGRLAESFNTMAEQLDANDRARKAFIANVSHELRTPIAIILGHTEQLQATPEARDERISQSLDTIQMEGQMLVRLVDDLLTSSRLQENSLELRPTAVDLSCLVNNVLAGIRVSAWEDRKVSVESVVSPQLSKVMADEQRLQQIISNLVYNALRHTPAGGLVVVQAEPHDDLMHVTISDTGMGMDEETARNVFTRYYQSERNKRHGDGTGLGLSIVQQLVEAHGGSIWVNSSPGNGTAFTFTLPLARG
jgi:signal transduction histidine kinase